MTLDDRVKMILGNQIVQIAALAIQVEELTERVKQLEGPKVAMPEMPKDNQADV
jgi:hypothetical protein